MLPYLAALKNMFTVWLNRIAGPVGNSTIYGESSSVAECSFSSLG